MDDHEKAEENNVDGDGHDDISTRIVRIKTTRKETTTCEEILTFLKETKQKELQMEYPVKNVKRSIRRAMDNFSRTGSTSLKRPGRPPMSETLREKIITLSRNKRYRR